MSYPLPATMGESLSENCPAGPSQIQEPREKTVKRGCCFKALSFGVIYYVVIVNGILALLHDSFIWRTAPSIIMTIPEFSHHIISDFSEIHMGNSNCIC